MVGEEKTLEKLKLQLATRKIVTQNDCWEWTGSKSKDGYGHTQWRRKQIPVHRLAAWLFKDFDLGSKMLVCHKCDNPSCFNPEHLFVGTDKDNSDDKVSKKRHHWGERTPTAKLTEPQVQEIKQTYKKGIVGYETLAKKYNVSKWAIRFIVLGINWKHSVPNEKA